MKIKLFILSILFTAALFSVNAESYWEGSASMSRYGEFPVKGFYGASNSFPLNSFVEVVNPANGKKVEVIVVNTLEDNNLFILLSKDAAEKLSIKEDDIITVKAAIVKKYIPDDGDDKVVTDDPDLNPAKAVLFPDSDDERDFPVKEEEPAEEKKDETVRRERDLADEIIETLIISDIPERKSEESVTEEEAENNEEEEVEITAIIVPDKEENIEETPEEPLTEKIITDEEGLLEKYDPEAVATEESIDKASEEDREYEEKLVLVPSSPKPPENGDSSYIEKSEDISVPEKAEFRKYNSSDEAVEELDSSSYYLQIGAYKDFESADKLAGSINIDYPVFLYKKGENGIYRVMAGPLKNDEKGAALYQVRIKGIKDAFIKKGE